MVRDMGVVRVVRVVRVVGFVWSGFVLWGKCGVDWIGGGGVCVLGGVRGGCWPNVLHLEHGEHLAVDPLNESERARQLGAHAPRRLAAVDWGWGLRRNLRRVVDIGRQRETTEDGGSILLRAVVASTHE